MTTPSRYQFSITGLAHGPLPEPGGPPTSLENATIHFDFYDLLTALRITDHIQAHALKKVVLAGQSDAKDFHRDVKEAGEILERWSQGRAPEPPTGYVGDGEGGEAGDDLAGLPKTRAFIEGSKRAQPDECIDMGEMDRLFSIQRDTAKRVMMGAEKLVEREDEIKRLQGIIKSQEELIEEQGGLIRKMQAPPLLKVDPLKVVEIQPHPAYAADYFKGYRQALQSFPWPESTQWDFDNSGILRVYGQPDSTGLTSINDHLRPHGLTLVGWEYRADAKVASAWVKDLWAAVPDEVATLEVAGF